jgi:hypothetical protein
MNGPKLVPALGLAAMVGLGVYISGLAGGTGSHVEAGIGEGFKGAVAELRQVGEIEPEEAAPEEAAPEEPPEGQPSEPTEYFRDDFDGDGLSEDWEVLNPNLDAFIVEDGALLILSATPGGLPSENSPNLFKLTREMPEGDWTVTARVSLDLQTGSEMFYMGLYDDKDNWIAAQVWSKPDKYKGHGVFLSSVKSANGQITRFNKRLAGIRCNVCSPDWNWSNFIERKFSRPIFLRLAREGRSFIVSGRQEPEGEQGEEAAQWLELEKVTSLRAKGSLALNLVQSKKTQGESLAHVDWVKIEVPQQQEPQ